MIRLSRLLSAAGLAIAVQVTVSVSPGLAADAPMDPIATVVQRVQAAVVKIISVKASGTEVAKRAPETAAAGSTDVQASSQANAQPKVPSEQNPGEPGQEAQKMMTTGSGFVIDPSGFIATNKHVIENAVAAFVVTADGVRYPAEIVGITSKADIALLKIDAGHPLAFETFGDSDKMRPGETVIAIGSPFGFVNSVTAGVVSAVNRDIMESPFDDYIQTDAAINHGNSGGPLFNRSGEVIGMNSLLIAPGTFSGSIGLGFAIPSNDLQFVYQRMIRKGQVNAGMLPIRTQQVTWMLAQAVGAPTLDGALVAALEWNGDQMMHGQIKPGDIILSFNGRSVPDPRALAREAAKTAPGSDAALEVFRDGHRFIVHVAVQAWPEGARPVLNDASPRHLGLALAQGPHGGALVEAVDPSGSAASSGILKGDIIAQVQQQSVSGPDEALRALRALPAGNRAYAAVLVERDGQRTWVPLSVPEQ